MRNINEVIAEHTRVAVKIANIIKDINAADSDDIIRLYREKERLIKILEELRKERIELINK